MDSDGAEWRCKKQKRSHDDGLSLPRCNGTAHYLPANLCTHAALRRMARRRASKRWSALVTAPTSRVARLMRPVLGESLWAQFVRHAEERYREPFLDAFDAPTLRCVGLRDGTPCPRRFEVDLRSPSAYDALERLHLDHEHDVRVTCDMWMRALPPNAAAWDDGVEGELLCHLLFGVADSGACGRRCVQFRCGPPRRWEEAGEYCHDLRLPHYTNVRAIVR